MQQQYPNEIAILIFKLLENCISDQEIQQLDDFFAQNPDAVHDYCNYVKTYTALRMKLNEQGRMGEELPSEECLDQTVWQRLAEDEKNSPTVELAQEPEPKPRIFVDKVEYPKIARRVSAGAVVAAVVSAAAIVLIFLFAYLAPPATGFRVAVLADSLHAKWAIPDGAMDKGDPVLTSRSDIVLQEGCIKFLFDNGAQVTLEGPCAFQVRTEDQIKMRYGRLYAIIPREAIGFSVYTDNAKIIDLGTEFGVQADIGGDTSLYVMQGKTTLIAGVEASKEIVEVGAGMGKRISADTLDISDIPFRQMHFVRTIHSDSNTIWRGQKTLSLADIVGGGNGLGTGVIDLGINLVNGNFIKPKGMPEFHATANIYRPVPSSPYIDGVFIPNGQTQQTVSSLGHVFRECPKSSGACYGVITNAIRILNAQAVQNSTVSGRWNAHCLLMHANMGITYDLQAMRSLLPATKIVRFKTKFGIEKEAIRPEASNADFWILVDGKIRYQKTQVREKTLFSADIEISEKDRFLTLMTTDGQDPRGRMWDNMAITAIDSDWCMYTDPVLVLE
ncbi:MAG: NPCBM/NEW2 domain-containing protein [Sedimentisphaerales bacterium]|nr:NPCBM/NEW2 domain-containing protein [Sedimentisphaerales bacterium]